MKIKIIQEENNIRIKVRTGIHEGIQVNTLEKFRDQCFSGFFTLVSVSSIKAEFCGRKGISFYDYLKGPSDTADFIKIILNLSSVIENLQMNHFSLKHLVLDPEFIFLESKTLDVQLVYLPLKEPVKNIGYVAFLRKAVKDFMPSDNREKELLTEIKEFTEEKEIFSVRELKSFLSAGLKSHEKESSQQNEEKRFYSEEKMASTLFSDEPVLINKASGIRISINRENFFIGKERILNDYFIGNNSAISRKHAEIIRKEGKYYIRDLSSSNHIYINGRQIIPEKNYELTNGMLINIGDESFMFSVKEGKDYK